MLFRSERRAARDSVGINDVCKSAIGADGVVPVAQLPEAGIPGHDSFPATAAHSRRVLVPARDIDAEDRKSTRLNSSHKPISYAVFCLKKKNI